MRSLSHRLGIVVAAVALVGCAGGCAGLALALDALTCAGDVTETTCCCSGSRGSEPAVPAPQACCQAEPDAAAVSSAVPAPVLPDVVTRTIEVVELRPADVASQRVDAEGRGESPPPFLIDCSFRI